MNETLVQQREVARTSSMKHHSITVMQWRAYNPVYKNCKLVDFEEGEFDTNLFATAKGLIDGYNHPVHVKQRANRKSLLENGLKSDTVLRVANKSLLMRFAR